MKAFVFTHEQLVRIACALTADELARSFGKYIETLAVSAWGADTPLGAEGVGASPEQMISCARRFAILFDQDEEVLPVSTDDTFGDWAARLEAPIREKMAHFRFHPATPAGHVDSRHYADDIFQDAAGVASLMQGRRRVISLVSPHSLMGMVASIMAPNLLGLEVKDARGMDPDALGEYVKFGDLVIATPTLWRYLSDTVGEFANNVMGLAFGERLSPDLLMHLRQRGLGAMRELYGSTETGVIGWRDTAPEPFTLFDHWSENEGAIVRHRPGGQRAKMMPMDDLVWKSARSFSIGARRDGAVQIGAVNVFPTAIAATICEHPDVSDCTVRVSQRPGTLDRLLADITLKPEKASDQEMAWSIDEWCRDRLRPPERPRILIFYESGTA